MLKLYANLRLIRRELHSPEVNTGLGLPGKPAARIDVVVPETTVHKYHGAVPQKHDVGCSRQIAAVKREAISEPMDHPSDDKFG